MLFFTDKVVLDWFPAPRGVHKDRMDSTDYNILFWYTARRSVLYHPVLWYIRTGWTVGITMGGIWNMVRHEIHFVPSPSYMIEQKQDVLGAFGIA